MTQAQERRHEDAADRYVVISADCHAGTSMPMYAEYLEPGYRDEFDAWDVRSRTRSRTCVTRVSGVPAQLRQSGPPTRARARRHRRRGDLPQHHPAVLPQRHSSAHPDPTSEQYERRWAGIPLTTAGWPTSAMSCRVGGPASRRSCSATSTRARRGPPGQGRGALRRRDAPASRPTDLPPLNAASYEPMWALCEELGVPVNMHGGTAGHRGPYPAGRR